MFESDMRQFESMWQAYARHFLGKLCLSCSEYVPVCCSFGAPIFISKSIDCKPDAVAWQA